MVERNLGEEILEGLREIKAYRAGKVDLVTWKLSDPSDPKEIRRKLKSLPSRICGIDGREYSNNPGLGTKSKGAKWSGKVFTEDSGTAS